MTKTDRRSLTTLLLALVLISSGCGDGGGGPTSPTAPVAPAGADDPDGRRDLYGPALDLAGGTAARDVSRPRLPSFRQTPG